MPERILRPGIIGSDAVNLLSWQAEVFYRRLMSVVDDYGRFDGRLGILRAALYPLKLDVVGERDIGKWLGETRKAALVNLYTVQGRPYVEVLKFQQRLRAAKSKYPPPPANDGELQASAGIRMTMPSETETETETETKGPAGQFVDPVPIPESLNTGAFRTAWERWITHRRSFKKPKDWAAFLREQLEWLAQYPEPVAIQSLNESRRQRWQGLFEPKNYNGNRTTGTQSARDRRNIVTGAAENAAAAAERDRQRAEAEANGTYVEPFA